MLSIGQGSGPLDICILLYYFSLSFRRELTGVITHLFLGLLTSLFSNDINVKAPNQWLRCPPKSTWGGGGGWQAKIRLPDIPEIRWAKMAVQARDLIPRPPKESVTLRSLTQSVTLRSKLQNYRTLLIVYSLEGSWQDIQALNEQNVSFSNGFENIHGKQEDYDGGFPFQLSFSKISVKEFCECHRTVFFIQTFQINIRWALYGNFELPTFI